MGIPVQKWQWPVNQTLPLGATCAACVKLHKDKTVLTFHHERVWERILSGRVISFAFYMTTLDRSRGSVARTYNKAKSWTKHLSPAFLPVFQFTFLWVMCPTESRIPALLSLAFCLKWNLVVWVELIVVERPRLILSVRWLPYQLTEPQDYWLRVMDTRLNGETLREKEVLVKLLLIRHTIYTHTRCEFFQRWKIPSISNYEVLNRPHLNKCILQ